MCTFLKLSKLLIFVSLFCAVIACSDDDDNVISPPITMSNLEIAKSDPNLSALVAALEKAGLDQTLEDLDTYTLLAPNNDAFEILFDSLQVSGLDEISTTQLQTMLHYHILPNGKYTTANLSSNQGAGYLNTLATHPSSNPYSLYYDATSGTKFNALATIVGGSEDQKATNGILHEIDAVLQVPDLLDLITPNIELSDLVAGLNRSDQANTLALLEDPSNTPITIFGPTNGAFQTLLEDLDETGETSMGTLDGTLLSQILAYHVILMSNTTESNLAAGSLSTLGGTITITQSPIALTDANGTTANITTSDLQAADGVLHIIDAALLPLP